MTSKLAVVLLPAFLWLQPPSEDSTDAMVKNLGSKDFQERRAAMRWLLERPNQAMPALRKATSSEDPEIARRAAMIVDDFEGRPLKELSAAIRRGAVDRVIAIVAEWPEGRHEEALLEAARGFTGHLMDLHVELGGVRFRLPWEGVRTPPIVKSGDHYIEPKSHLDDFFFLRGRKVTSAKDSPNKLVFASESATGYPEIKKNAFFVGGSLRLHNPGGVIVVSCGDVTLRYDVYKCLIIARGKVICDDRIHMQDARIIAGDKVILNKPRLSGKCIITENEPNPLGYLRFSKAQAAPSPKDTDEKK